MSGVLQERPRPPDAARSCGSGGSSRDRDPDGATALDSRTESQHGDGIAADTSSVSRSQYANSNLNPNQASAGWDRW
ncbi:hypothetical protein [Natrinema salifodinae]|uniref:Uncharacterized protein n=1 Tax=Natrinema salifodinae TaxID=1202768 RepID=A0A1I0MB34_9EURY|nr:hypothetical protein [Natrinema salifodinae]SEV85573.1 hypothetical protein SAMN05216285_0741 [Natrinema salifodinae]